MKLTNAARSSCLSRCWSAVAQKNYESQLSPASISLVPIRYQSIQYRSVAIRYCFNPSQRSGGIKSSEDSTSIQHHRVQRGIVVSPGVSATIPANYGKK
eukprot:gene1054-biopygen1152